MRVLNQGKTLSPGDLGINVREPQGGLVDPFSISYSIFSLDQNDVATLASPPRIAPIRASQGTFYIGGLIPNIWQGKYRLAWYLRQYQAGEEATIFEDFEVVSINPATTSFEAPSVLLTSAPGLNKVLVERIMAVRELLSDENPDRNYKFRPPAQGKIVAGFNERVGYIWTDRTIIRMLRMSIEQANVANPMAMYNYTVENAPRAWGEAIAVGAAAKCLSKEAARWTEESFSYSLNGIALDLNKGSEYQALANDYANEFREWLPNLTANRPACVGLRQNKFLLG